MAIYLSECYCIICNDGSGNNNRKFNWKDACQAQGGTLMLLDIHLFSDLEPGELETISSKAVVRQYPRNTIVLNEGDHSDSLYVVNSGKVKIFLSDSEGKEVILNSLGPGDYFGEMALLDSAPRSASAITTEKCQLALISKADFEAFLSEHPAAMIKIMQGIIKRLRSLTENVRSLALMDVYGRVARVLLELSEESEDGTLVITEGHTQQDIANRVGASREMVSRIFKDLKTGGYIDIHNRHITIKAKLPPSW
jgi:CRP/FNR family cyclic AMP-dependent transcriptional regulator